MNCICRWLDAVLFLMRRMDGIEQRHMELSIPTGSMSA